MGIGLATNQVAAGMFIGLGVGFVLSTIFAYFGNRATTKRGLEERIMELEKKIK